MKNLKSKDPLLSVLLNCVFPGFGHFYAGAQRRGLIIFGVIAGLWALLAAGVLHPTANLAFLFQDDALMLLIILRVVGLVISILILVDGYRCAKRFNAAHNLHRTTSLGRRVWLIAGIVITCLGLNLSLLLALTIRTYLVQAFKIPSEAMKPTLAVGDRLLVYKLAYKKSKPKRGDIVVFVYPEDPRKNFVKRMIAWEGETVEIRNGGIYINGEPVHVPGDIRYSNLGKYGQAGQVVTVPAGHYYVLGDNSAASRDSRMWGFVPEKIILGRAYKIYYPFNRSGPLN